MDSATICKVFYEFIPYVFIWNKKKKNQNNNVLGITQITQVI